MKIIKSELNTPYVRLDKEICTLTIVGKSYPEHPLLFYGPIIKELENFVEGDLDKPIITLQIALEMLNTLSTQYLFQTMKEIYESTKRLKVDWYYEEDDEDMEEAGENFKSSFPKSNFNLIGVEDIRKV